VIVSGTDVPYVLDVKIDSQERKFFGTSVPFRRLGSPWLCDCISSTWAIRPDDVPMRCRRGGIEGSNACNPNWLDSDLCF